MPQEFDVVCLGGGVAGEAIAVGLQDSGLTLAVIERELVGGECAHSRPAPERASPRRRRPSRPGERRSPRGGRNHSRAARPRLRGPPLRTLRQKRRPAGPESSVCTLRASSCECHVRDCLSIRHKREKARADHCARDLVFLAPNCAPTFRLHLLLPFRRPRVASRECASPRPKSMRLWYWSSALEISAAVSH